MVAIIVAIILAALAYWLCIALGLPFVVALLAALLVLLAAFGGVSRRGRL